MATASEASGVKGCAWSITINNPTDADLEAWKTIKMVAWVKDAQGQLEQGENGTPHLQALLKTQSVRFAAVKKLLPRAHIEKARNTFALAQYVAKEETRVAPIVADKVATPRVVQERLTSNISTQITHKGLPAVWRSTFSRNCKTLIWSQDLCEEDELEFPELVKRNERWITHHADKLIDAAVAELIEEGYYGIEFVIANNQVRNGYKKFLPSIIIRHNASSQVCPPSQAPSQDSPPSQDDEEGISEGSGDCPDHEC